MTVSKRKKRAARKRYKDRKRAAIQEAVDLVIASRTPPTPGVRFTTIFDQVAQVVEKQIVKPLQDLGCELVEVFASRVQPTESGVVSIDIAYRDPRPQESILLTFKSDLSSAELEAIAKEVVDGDDDQP